jgi:signal transduction histidine kinase
MAEQFRPALLIAVALCVAALVLASRALGFGEGILLAATPASGVALAAALVLRLNGAIAAAAGFALAGAVAGLPVPAILADAAMHGLAAGLGAGGMRMLARRRRPENKTREYMVFLAGVGISAIVVAAGIGASRAAGLLDGLAHPAIAPLLALVFEPLGIMTVCAVLFTLGEVRAIMDDARPAIGTALLAAGLLAILLVMVSGAGAGLLRLPGMTLLLSLPFCLWVAMQRRSLDGAAIALVASHVLLVVLLSEAGAITAPDFVVSMLYLVALVALCQLVHAVNLDRLGAFAEIAAHKGELEARVAERTARLMAMTERAQAADAAKSKFVATVSHEVRNPLNGVIGMASVVLAGDLDPRTRRNVEVIRASGLHLLDVINRILDFSRLGHEPEPEPPVEFDLRELVAEVIEEARALPAAEGLVLTAEIAPTVDPARRGSRQSLRQVLTNLVANGVKFTERGGVTLRVRVRAEDLLRIEVQDTGIGIASDVQGRIFRPFEQADASTTRRFGGTGLGLAISAEMVARMGGRIGVLGEEGQGSLFWIELPLPPAGSARAAEPVALGA